MYDKEKLAAAITKETGISLESNDPSFAVARLFQVILEQTASELQSDLRARLAEFDKSVEKVEAKAGKLIAQQVKAAAVEFNTQLDKDLTTARQQITQLLGHVVNSRYHLLILISVALASALFLFGGGVWIGSRHLH